MNNFYEGKIISIDPSITEVKDDAFSVELDEQENYILKLYIADPITNNEALIEQITGNKLNFEDSSNTFSVKSALRKYSLSSRQEQKCFCFEFKISPSGRLLKFYYGKQKVKIDYELTYDDVVDAIDQEEELYEFFCKISELSNVLYSKRNAGAEFQTYSSKIDYDFTFPREFTVLLNILLAEHFHSCYIPFIYDVEEYDKYKNHMKFWYYTSTPTKTITEKNLEGYYYGAFTSPLQNFEDLKNLEIFNDFMVKDYSDEERETLKKIYTSQLTGYKRMKEERQLNTRRK